MHLYFIDTETTGFGKKAKIIQFAGILVHVDDVAEGIKIEDIFTQHFDPQCEIHAKATECHGITNEMVAGKPLFSDFKEEIESKCREGIIVAHNARFDLSMLENEGIVLKGDHIDTLKVARHRITKKGQKHKLLDLADYYGLDFSDIDAHDAAGDVFMLQHIFYELYQDLRKKQIAKMIKLSR